MTDRCLDRLRDENSLIWPMMVSAMFRALSRALSCSDRGSAFMFLRTRVNSVRPRRNRSCASFHGPLNVTQRVAKLTGQVLPYGSRLDRLAPAHRPQPFGRVDRLDIAAHQPDFGHVAGLQALPVLGHVLR